ncbi:hypothetical protein CGLAU_11370 [Corynebacterium glaucum]|uniref:Uncharacterized protein n=1 Tax=Corynebacterium glaucum TaxID=187491 RepID=A0A1Q2HZB5_9CORY|nr:hypothetical protein [Corynebacterium glaucum]AQQ16205.1 hypothetical protein CGLAU_11370 [Corynebacterium glaucum]WJZ08690.1 hypothetical protein CGLAUT_11175 [Corynebacterium glaucum]
MRSYTDINNIDFSIIRERVLRNIRQDLYQEHGYKFDEVEFHDAFDAVVRKHNANAVIEDFVPLLVEAEMKDRLAKGELFPNQAA